MAFADLYNIDDEVKRLSQPMEFVSVGTSVLLKQFRESLIN